LKAFSLKGIDHLPAIDSLAPEEAETPKDPQTEMPLEQETEVS